MLVLIITAVFIKRQIANGYKALRKMGGKTEQIKTNSDEEAQRWVLRARFKASLLGNCLSFG